MACDSIWVNKTGAVDLDSPKTDTFPFFYQDNRIIVGPNHGNHNGTAQKEGIYFDAPWKDKRGFISNTENEITSDDKYTYILGRIFVRFKVISFWNYPVVSDFNKIIDLLEEREWTQPNFDTKKKIKFWNNGWKVEIFKDECEKSQYSAIFPRTYEEYLERFEQIPIENYAGGGIVPKEYYLQHLLSPIQKQNKISARFPGYGYKKLKWQLPGETEVAARARMYQEKLITKFNKYKKAGY